MFDKGVIKGIDPASFQLKKDDIAASDMAVAWYSIVHPKGTLMWAAGLKSGRHYVSGALVLSRRPHCQCE